MWMTWPFASRSRRSLSAAPLHTGHRVPPGASLPPDGPLDLRLTTTRFDLEDLARICGVQDPDVKLDGLVGVVS